MAPQATGLMVGDDAGGRAFLADVLRLQGDQALPVGTVKEAEADRQWTARPGLHRLHSLNRLIARAR